VNQKEGSISASIICPVFNMAGRLQELEKWVSEISVNPQIEIIVINDFLDEATSDELHLICSNLQNVHLIEGRFGNPGSARNAGLSFCKGRYIAFWDCDDEPNAINFLSLLKLVEQNNSDICIARYSVFNEVTKSTSSAPAWSGDFGRDSKTFALNPGIWRMIFKREILVGIKFNPLKMAEDQIFICQAILKSKVITFSDDQVYTYFTGSDNHLTKNWGALQDLLPAMQITKALIRRNVRVDLGSVLNLMCARQFISGIKHGSINTKLRIVACSIERGFILRPSFVKAILYSLKNTVRG
jgi:glycosyltransferase involved in cell wall biosynthesis